MNQEFRSFGEFYPYYIGEHSHPLTKICHFVGTGSFLGMTLTAVLDQRVSLVLFGILTAYGLAWISHFFVEKNQPATFRHPLYSLRADFKMFFELLFLKRRFF